MYGLLIDQNTNTAKKLLLVHNKSFKEQILEVIPLELPQPKARDTSINHAPKSKIILSKELEKLALPNALRYFDKSIKRINLEHTTNEMFKVCFAGFG